MIPARTTRVAVEHTSDFPVPLVARAGSQLSLERRSAEYPGWVWCRDPGGMGAWVPETFIEINGESAVLAVDYDSTELTVAAGASVEILTEVAGWVWCRDQEGRLGWLPNSSLTGVST